jgi:hypothetical protein
LSCALRHVIPHSELCVGYEQSILHSGQFDRVLLRHDWA